MVVPTINLKKIRTKISETKMENNCHHGTLFGTGVVEAKPLDEIKKNNHYSIWGPFKPEFAILQYCCASLYGKV